MAFLFPSVGVVGFGERGCWRHAIPPPHPLLPPLPLVDHTTYPPSATSGSAAAAVNAHPSEVRLWEGTAPGSEGKTSPEVVNWRTEKDSITGNEFSFPTVTSIHVPSITPYLPAKGKATGAAVIIAPGGGNMFLTINHEGYEVASYLADHGVAAFVLKYRLARAPESTYKAEVESMADGVRAMRLVRARAAEWGVDPHRVGLIGFSAGGAVVEQVAIHADGGNPNAADPVDRQSSKMDFHGIIYSGMPNAMMPGKDWPPVFLACSNDDSGNVAGPTMGANATARPAAGGMADIYLKYKAMGIPAELHIYSVGGHGFGARHRPIEESRLWMDNFLGWLGDRGFAKTMMSAVAAHDRRAVR